MIIIKRERGLDLFYMYDVQASNLRFRLKYHQDAANSKFGIVVVVVAADGDDDDAGDADALYEGYHSYCHE